MRFFLLALALAGLVGASTEDWGNAVQSGNVNSRYTVESVEVTPAGSVRLSSGLRDRLRLLVGNKFDQKLLDEMVSRISKELRNRRVVTRITRGSLPDQVRVAFQVEVRNRDFDVDLPRLLFHSRQNFSFGLDLAYRAENHRVFFGALTDNDQLAERYSGIHGGYERDGLLGDRLRAGVEAASWRLQWSDTTGTAAQAEGAPAALYRQRTEVIPSATLQLLRPLTLQLGVSLGRLEPNLPAVRNELSSAAFTTLRFQRRWGLASDNRHRVEASYGLRVASRTLGSDFVFSRHSWTARYLLQGRQEQFTAVFQAGLLDGRAPLWERFILGNSTTLRGWNKYDLAPLGADRFAHGSLDYHWRKLRLVYDVGSLWVDGRQRAGDGKIRHSAAIGLAENRWGGFSLLVAFPLREGRVEPIFIAGMNF